MTEATDAELIRMLEERLLDPQARRDAAFLDQVLADDFIEFGRSGAVCDKAGAIEALLAQADYPGARLSVFRRALAPTSCSSSIEAPAPTDRGPPCAPRSGDTRRMAGVSSSIRARRRPVSRRARRLNAPARPAPRIRRNGNSRRDGR
ncbi:MAG: nuclear transport factor 2 family protein [Rhodoblastus sp.]|nr:MAG: nuclear transport factor 2 family protein [Rhodoblastus sp.]